MKSETKAEWTLAVATANGSGSQSANTILVRSLFRMGVPVGGKNLFPSNIQGLPTWFSIRVHPKGYVGRQSLADIFISMNSTTAKSDLDQVQPGGFFFHDEFRDFTPHRQDVTAIAVPFKKIVQGASSSIRMRKVLANIGYVGLLTELLGFDRDVVLRTIEDQFKGKGDVIDANIKALDAGIAYAREHLQDLNFSFRAEGVKGANDGKLLMDGNTASALGLVYGGCSFLSWYPITPSSSVAENFEAYAQALRVDSKGHSTAAVVQAEDELSAINMVLGAGWAGARAVTATSGPGLSLMAEAAGLSYFAEIPAVIWDVQRAGPSTGLPTRTMQGDVLSAQRLSHGDTEHVLLFPANPKECFDFGRMALDLAEELQTLVIVLSDLDLGMNLWISEAFEVPATPLRRGKVLDAAGLEKLTEFERYGDSEGDGIPYRTLPGTDSPKAGYFTRGTGHNVKAGYSEDPAVFEKLLTRLKLKTQTARKLVPPPVVDLVPDATVGLVAFGSTDLVMDEVRHLLGDAGMQASYMRLRAWPANEDVRTFLERHSHVYVIEQNRDGQMREMLATDFSDLAPKLRSTLSFNGLPIAPQETAEKILAAERSVR